MAKNPANRYTTAGDMAAELRAAVTPKRTSRRKLLKVGLGLTATSVGLIVALSLSLSHPLKGPDPTPPPSVATPPPAPDELLFGPAIWRPDAGVAFWLHEDGGPVYDRDCVAFRARLFKPGYVALFAYYPGEEDYTVQRFLPEDKHLDLQRSVDEFLYPEMIDSQGRWRKVAPNQHGYGPEAVLLVVSDEPFTKELLTEFESGPSPLLELASKHEAVTIPPPMSRLERDVGEEAGVRAWEEAKSTPQIAFGDDFAAHLKKFNFRQVGACIFYHAKSYR